MRALALWFGLALGPFLMAAEAPRVVALPGKSPLATFRLVFATGSAADPAGKFGLASMTAAMLTQGGTKDMAYRQIVETMYPMATSVGGGVDKEMTTFSAATHVDNLEAFYKLFRAILLDPGWRAEDLSRLRDNHINALRVQLRGNNDEELGKEVLYSSIYEGTPYGHYNLGTVAGLNAITMDDLKDFYRRHYTRRNLTIGIAGGYPPEFLERVKRDFGALPAGEPEAPPVVNPKPVAGVHMVIVDKQTRSVAYSIGFPIDVKRGDPDFPALLVAQSYFGQHRMSGGRLYDRMRELRGLNYGDYAYIEYFPSGMFVFEPDPNLARRSQIFQIWIRPVEPPTAVFALRLAMFELNRLIEQGLTEEEFERARSFVSKNVNLLTKTKRAELGYDIDSLYYHIPNYPDYIQSSLAKLTRDDVNRAIRKHLRTTDLTIVAVSDHAAELKAKLLSGAPSPMTYNSPKPDDVLREDRIVERWNLNLKPENVTIVPVNTVLSKFSFRSA